MRNWNITAGNGVLVLMMIASLVILHAMGLHGFLGGMFAIPPTVLPVFFIWPLCQTVLRGIVAARQSMGGADSESPGARFRSVVGRPVWLWIILWSAYFVV